MNIEQFIEENIELIDNNDFTELYSHCVIQNCGKLTEVLYECGINPLLYVTEVPEWFAYKSDLSTIVIPNNVTSIGNDAFRNCENLTSITIPSSVTSIGEEVFWECSSLTNVTIPDGVTSIGLRAFYKCLKLADITIPNSVTSIEVCAFQDCGRLSITYSGTKQQWRDLVAGKKIFPGSTYVCNCSDGVVEE